jgi:hypothetical protein
VRILRQASRVIGLALACALTGPFAPSPAPAASAASSNVLVNVAVGVDVRAPVIPRGGSATVGSLAFKAGASVETIGPDSADNVSIRLLLPAGLRWGTDLPDATENCTATPNTAECRPGFILDPQNPGMRAAGWIWDVVAETPGSYQLRAELISSSADDPDPSDNTSLVTVVVARAIAAGAARITPARPRAGAVVSARVAVQARRADHADPRVLYGSGRWEESRGLAAGRCRVGEMYVRDPASRAREDTPWDCRIHGRRQEAGQTVRRQAPLGAAAFQRVEPAGLEPATSWLPATRSPN